MALVSDFMTWTCLFAFTHDWEWSPFLRGVVNALVFGVIGIFLTILGFKVFDWITPRIDIEKELAEKNNIAVAIVIAAVILGISYIVTVAIQ